MSAAALEFGIDAAAGNLQFPWEDTAPISSATFPDDNYFWGGAAWLRSPLGDDAALRVSVERDPVLRNSAFATVEFERGIAKISAGPFFGFLNTDTTPFSAGISATVRLQWPGVAFVSLRSDGATAISLFQEDVAPQARTEVSAGFYVPHAIVSAVVEAKRFNETLASGDIIADSFTRYALEFEIFKKNVPYTLMASIGYEQRSKRFETSDLIDSLGAVVAGVETAASIGPALDLKANFETGVYVFGFDELADKSPGSGSFFFRAGLGFSLDLAALPPRAPKPAKPKAEETPSEPAAAEKPAEGEPAPEGGAPERGGAVGEPRNEATTFSRLAMTAGGGLAYDRFITLPSELFLFELLANARGNAWFGIGYRFSPLFSLGTELGLGYITFSFEGAEGTFNVFDAPLRLVADFNFGALGLGAFGGLMGYGIYVVGADPEILFGIEAGGRLRFGTFYVEGSYLFGLDPSAGGEAFGVSVNPSFLRLGTGVSFKIR
jgi:hypothetical protein